MQVKLAGSQPAEVQSTSRMHTPSTGFAGALSGQAQSPAEPSVRHTPEVTLACGKGPFSAAAQAQPKDYGAPWAVAAAENDTSTASLAADTPTVGKPSQPREMPAQDAASHQDEIQQRKEFAPSPSTTLPKQHPSHTDSLADQLPSTPGSSFMPFFRNPSAAAPPLSPALNFGLPAASWKAVESQPPVHQLASSDQHQQQHETAVSTPPGQFAVPVLANGLSTQAGTQAQKAASTSSDGSAETSVNLYPFPIERSAQDRLEGIASSAPYAQDVQGLYVFGRNGGSMLEHDKPSAASAAANVPLSHENGHHVASPSGPHQVQPKNHAVVFIVLDAYSKAQQTLAAFCEPLIGKQSCSARYRAFCGDVAALPERINFTAASFKPPVLFSFLLSRPVKLVGNALPAHQQTLLHQNAAEQAARPCAGYLPQSWAGHTAAHPVFCCVST